MKVNSKEKYVKRMQKRKELREQLEDKKPKPDTRPRVGTALPVFEAPIQQTVERVNRQPIDGLQILILNTRQQIDGFQ